MNPVIKPLLQQASFFGVLALGAYTMNTLNAVPNHHIVCESSIIVNSYPGIASLLTSLARLQLDQGLRRIVEKTQQLLEWDQKKRLSSRWYISRLSTEIVSDANRLCKQHTYPSDDMYRTMLLCEQEVIPQLEQQLQDVLHNHLLNQRLG